MYLAAIRALLSVLLPGGAVQDGGGSQLPVSTAE